MIAQFLAPTSKLYFCGRRVAITRRLHSGAGRGLRSHCRTVIISECMAPTAAFASQSTSAAQVADSMPALWWSRASFMTYIACPRFQQLHESQLSVLLYLRRRRMSHVLQELDLSGAVVEPRNVACLHHLTRLTALYLAQLRVLSAPPTLAGLLLARALSPLTALQRLTLAGFATSSEAALCGAGAACARTLTWLDISGTLNKCRNAPPDFEAIAALTELRELRLMLVNWGEQGVSGAAAAATFAALTNLSHLWFTLPEGAAGRAWAITALAGVNENLQVLVLKGAMTGEWQGCHKYFNEQEEQSKAMVKQLELSKERLKVNDAYVARKVDQGVQAPQSTSIAEARSIADASASASANDSATGSGGSSAEVRASRRKLRAAIQELGILRFRRLQALVCLCEAAPPATHTDFEEALAAEVGLPAGALLLHIHRTVKDILPRGAVCVVDDHPYDMRLVFSKFASSSDSM